MDHHRDCQSWRWSREARSLSAATMIQTTLPECDSKRAKDTLSDVFEDKKLNPTSYSEIKTLSSAADKVSCEATLPTKDQGTLDVKYQFTWQDKKPQIEYTIATTP